MSRKQPELDPNNPQKEGHEATTSTDMTTTSQINGELNIANLYPEFKDNPAVHVENPYTINGGCMKQYNFMSNLREFQINGKNPLDAIRNGLIKLGNENLDIYNRRKRMTVNIQKNSANRTNKLHKFMIKIYRIEHPVYKYKLEFYKI